jgi:hypothetical protein
MSSNPIPFFAPHDTGTAAWVIVAAYVVALLLAVRAARGGGTARERKFWWIAALVLLALGFNKQLDLQTDLTAIGRGMARQEGWYGDRRMVQLLMMAIGGCIARAVGAWLLRLTKCAHASVRLGLAGLLALGVFVTLRAASFHHVDVALGTRVGGTKLHILLELGGIVVVAAGALWAKAPRRPGPYRRPGYHR